MFFPRRKNITECHGFEENQGLGGFLGLKIKLVAIRGREKLVFNDNLILIWEKKDVRKNKRSQLFYWKYKIKAL